MMSLPLFKTKVSLPCTLLIGCSYLTACNMYSTGAPQGAYTMYMQYVHICLQTIHAAFGTHVHVVMAM